jgi:hypothetical protein
VMRFANTWPIPPTSLYQLRNSYDIFGKVEFGRSLYIAGPS